MRIKKRQNAFTLLEIMLVISIIVVLLGLAISKMGNPTGFAKGVAVKSDIQTIGTQLKLYESMNGFLPTTEQGLQALVTQPSSEPRPQRWYQLFKEVPKDPFGNNYIYLSPGRKNPTSYDLYSAGQDRRADTADDDWGN
ncbi:MAG TPA: type II secretion system major pseudopilin GspG [Chthoniobacterales bacterium]|jgi:general secretion pathway protein G|nr:type II secretion system major pseudopilin GspG [Chthoniobacterales bacterium]